MYDWFINFFSMEVAMAKASYHVERIDELSGSKCSCSCRGSVTVSIVIQQALAEEAQGSNNFSIKEDDVRINVLEIEKA